MRNKSIIILLIVSSVYMAGCLNLNKENKNRIFLDFYLGMPDFEFKSHIESLETDNKIFSKVTDEGTSFFYNFQLEDGNKQTVRIKFRFDDDKLNGIKLEFGLWTGKAFWSYTSREKVEEVFKLYIDKYGESTENEQTLHYQIWHDNNIIIQFNKGSGDILLLNQKKAFIEYSYSKEFNDLVNKRQLKKNKKDI